MTLAHDQLLQFFGDTEARLLSRYPQSADYLPLIRSFIYFSQRPGFAADINARADTATAGRALGMVRSLCNALWQLARGCRARQLFVAPAAHRNVRAGDAFRSKHLDSLLERYGQGDDLVWEVGTNARSPGLGDRLGTDIYRLGLLASRLRRAPGRITRLVALVAESAAESDTAVTLDVRGLTHALMAFDASRALYRRYFRGSPLERSYLVVFYSMRHLPLLAALNDLGIETVEYQHGIQNDRHPLYTGWTHLPGPLATLPRRVLVWDEVSHRRIGLWAKPLGVAVEVVGNLWCAAQAVGAPARDREGIVALVALQLYPGYFNHALLDVMEGVEGIRWLFREHPIYPLSAEDRADLMRRFPSLEIIGAGDEPLEASLGRADCCITGYSTVAIEALLYGRAAIFTHEHARSGLGDYIDGERCFYADNAASIAAALGAVAGKSAGAVVC